VIVVVNAGSSSLKLAALDDHDQIVARHSVEQWDGGAEPVHAFMHAVGSVDAVGHRVVHGGTEFTTPVVIDDDVVHALRGLTPLAPLHQPRSLDAIDAARDARPEVLHVACFDTAFHATLPPAAYTYALPSGWRDRWPLRRFGFHGLSHAYASRRAAELAGADAGELRVISCHLGAGASLCAIAGGRSVDTTMGYTPLDGLVKASRAGSVDPGLVLWLAQTGGMSAADIEHGLEHESGLVALAGTADFRAIDQRRMQGDTDAQLAFDVYTHRLRRELGAMAAALGGVDACVFTGGIGEHAPSVRAAAGIPVDVDANAIAKGDTEITAPGAALRTFVVTAREDLEIARGVNTRISRRRSSPSSW
jgi:acetate kinase